MFFFGVLYGVWIECVVVGFVVVLFGVLEMNGYVGLCDDCCDGECLVVWIGLLFFGFLVVWL